jgi:uncharacterized protein YcgI (DUF1989 family)
MDTLREQGAVYLTAGSTLLSSEGRPMLTITADTCGRHDTLGGACASESNTVRYDLEKRHMHSCRDNWMQAIAAHPAYGLTKRDITPQHQLLHERTGDRRGRADLRGRHLRPRQVRGDARPRWM